MEASDGAEVAGDGAWGEILFPEHDEVVENIFPQNFVGVVDIIFGKVADVAFEIGGVCGERLFSEAGFEDACAEIAVEFNV